uniref:DUF1985 domain-containing protein n=1 Tax=Cannabis sativa TaxID=3483 RepID=A0A803P675_CANSA
MWFNIAGEILRFSIEEFSLDSRLDYSGQCDKLRYKQEQNLLKEKIFVGFKEINKKAVEKAFVGKMFGDDDELTLKVSILYFVHCFVLSDLDTKKEESLSLHLDGFFVDKNLDEIGKEKSLEIDDVGSQGWLSEASHNQATRFGELPSWAMALSDSIHDAVLSCSIHVPTDLESCNGRRNELLSPFPSDFLWRQPLFDQLIANLYHPVRLNNNCIVVEYNGCVGVVIAVKNLSKQRGCGGGESVAKGIARMARDQIVNGPLKDEFVGVSLIAEATGGDEHDGALTKDLASDVNVEESDPNVVVENAGTIDHVTSHIERRISKPSLHLQSLYAQQLSSSSKATVVTMLKVYVLCNNLLLTMKDKYGQLLYFVPAVNKLDPDFDFGC